MRTIVTRGDAVAIAFLNVKIPLADSCQYERYKMSETDKLIMTIGRKGRTPILIKQYPRDFLDESGNSFVVQLSPKETARLPCLLYEVCLTLDIDGKGKEVFTLIKQELEVVAK